MTGSFTFTESATFTVTHARHIAAKVATDLKRIQRFYGKPSDEMIAKYEAEIVALLKGGYLSSVTYGFKRGGSFIEPTVRYTASDLSGLNDDDPGRVRPGADATGASFSSFLIYSPSWDALSTSERERFERDLPFARTTAPEPGISGYLVADLTYSAGGRSLSRSSVRTH